MAAVKDLGAIAKVGPYGKGGQRETGAVEKARAPLVITSPARRAELLQLRDEYAGVSTETQRALLLRALSTGPVTTIEAGECLDMRHPCGRARDLILAGHHIVMGWVQQPTQRGTLHTVGEYTLIKAVE